MKFRWVRIIVAIALGAVAWWQRHTYTAAYPATLWQDLRNGHAAVTLLTATAESIVPYCGPDA